MAQYASRDDVDELRLQMAQAIFGGLPASEPIRHWAQGLAPLADAFGPRDREDEERDAADAANAERVWRDAMPVTNPPPPPPPTAGAPWPAPFAAVPFAPAPLTPDRFAPVPLTPDRFAAAPLEADRFAAAPPGPSVARASHEVAPPFYGPDGRVMPPPQPAPASASAGPLGRIADWTAQGFGSEPLGFSLENRANYPMTYRTWQPFVAPLDFAARLPGAALGALGGTAGEIYRAFGGNESEANRLGRDFAQGGQAGLLVAGAGYPQIAALRRPGWADTARGPVTTERTPVDLTERGTLSKGTPETTPREIRRSELGEKIGEGGEKDVHAYGENHAVGVLRADTKEPRRITEELAALKQLRDVGMPVVDAQPVTVDGRPGVIMDRYEVGSKSIFPKEGGPGRGSEFLNERSVSDLKEIKRIMVEKKVWINDLQFLIGKDGRVVVSDPIAVEFGRRPSKNNLGVINRLIRKALENGPSK